MRQFNNAVNNAFRLAVVAVFAVFALTANAQGNPEAQNSIQALSVGGAPGGGKLVLRVEMKSALANPPAGFTINTPPRIAFDFPNTANGLGKSIQEFGEGELRSANIVQVGNRTRLVVNLNQMLSFDTQTDGNILLITLQGKTPGAAAATTVSHFAEAKPAMQKHSLRDVDFHRGKNGEGRIQVDLSDANVGIDIKQQGKSLIVDFIKTSLPRNLQRKLDVTDFGTPVEGIDTFTQGDDVRMVIEPKGLWEQVAYQTDNKFIVEIKQVTEDPNKLVKSGQIGYAGEKLTLNFQNIAVREALYVIGDFINSNGIPMNMLISDTVSGNLTLRLKDVPWDQALDIILQSKGLDMRKNGNVMQIAPRAELDAKEKISLAAKNEISELEPTHTESFPLSYQKGEAVVAILSNDKQRVLSKRGSIVVDSRTNTLFIKDTPSALEEVRKMLKQIDVPVRQVMIEARFVEAATTFGQTLGGRLGWKNTNCPPGALVAGCGFTAIKTGAQDRVQGQADFNVNLPIAAAASTLSLALFNPDATKLLSLELAASETDSVSKNIASPRVVTADATAATISSGTQIPYQTFTVNEGAKTAFITAALSLTVTPQITPDDHINMQLDVHKDSPQATTPGAAPPINTNSVKTQVLVENGGTVVVGGVYTQDETNQTNKVPLLGDIPVLGWMFKQKTNAQNKKELLVFITPKILKDTLNLK